MDPNTDSLVAQRPEHCITCYRLIRPGESYHQTEENTVLCLHCAGQGADMVILSTIQAADDLAVDVGDGRLRLRRGISAVIVYPSEVRHLVAALVEGAASLVDQQSSGPPQAL